MEFDDGGLALFIFGVVETFVGDVDGPEGFGDEGLFEEVAGYYEA